MQSFFLVLGICAAQLFYTRCTQPPCCVKSYCSGELEAAPAEKKSCDNRCIAWRHEAEAAEKKCTARTPSPEKNGS
jgi:hypothetical protein